MSGGRADLAAFAAAVRGERERAGLTQAELAELPDVGDLHSIWDWEHARKDGRRSVLRACWRASLEGAALAQRILRHL